jgi:hypothetical protein
MKRTGPNSYIERIYITPRKYAIADKLIREYGPKVKKTLKDNPGPDNAATIKIDQIKKLLSNGYFDPEISDKTVHEALEIFAEKCLRSEGYETGYSNNDEGKEVFVIWPPKEAQK